MIDDEIDWISEGEEDQAVETEEEEKCVEKYAEERSFTKAAVIAAIAAIVIIAAIGGGVYMMLHPSTQEKSTPVTELTAVSTTPTPTPTIHIPIPGIEGVNLLIRGNEVAFERSGTSVERTDFYKIDSNIVAFTKNKDKAVLYWGEPVIKIYGISEIYDVDQGIYKEVLNTDPTPSTESRGNAWEVNQRLFTGQEVKISGAVVDFNRREIRAMIATDDVWWSEENPQTIKKNIFTGITPDGQTLFQVDFEKETVWVYKLINIAPITVPSAPVEISPIQEITVFPTKIPI